jgi:hypothetical protein
MVFIEQHKIMTFGAEYKKENKESDLSKLHNVTLKLQNNNLKGEGYISKSQNSTLKEQTRSTKFYKLILKGQKYDNIKLQNITLELQKNKTVFQSNNKTRIQNDSSLNILQDEFYVEQQEHASRKKTRVIVARNRKPNSRIKARKNVRMQAGKVINNGKSEKFFFKQNNGQRGANKKFFGFVTKPTIGTGLGGVNQRGGGGGGEIAISLPKGVKHLNIDIIHRPGRGGGKGGGKGGSGGAGGGGVIATTPDSPEYPDAYYDNPLTEILPPGASPDPGPIPDYNLPGPAPAPEGPSGPTDYGAGADYGADYGR